MTNALPKDHTAALEELIDYLEAQPVLPRDVAASKNKKFMQGVFSGMFETGASFGEASGTLPHLNRPDAQEYIKSIANDLLEQAKITRASSEAWFAHGEYPAPGYPWRITVILRKAKAFDLERRFLAAYCKHFFNTLGAKDAKIAERAIKVGAYSHP